MKVHWMAPILATLIAINSVWAGQDVQTAEATVRTTIDAVMEVLRDPEMETDLKRTRIIDIVNPVFDFALMAKLSLGPKYWPQLTSDQQIEYTDLFIQQLRCAYLDKIGLHSEETVNFEPAEAVRDRVYVKTIVSAAEDCFEIIYKLRFAGETWKVYDVEIEGVSVVSSYRSQFVDFLRQHDTNELLEDMRSKITPAPDDTDT